MNKRLILQDDSIPPAPKCISVVHSISSHSRLWAVHEKVSAFLVLVVFLISQSASAALFLPTISNIADQTTDEDTPTTVIPFVIWDLLTPLPLLTVSASSSKKSLVPDANIVLGGSGGSRTVRITPAPNQFGTTTIQIRVTDLLGGVAIDTFVLTVKSENDLPDLSHIPDQTIVENTATTPLLFAVSDFETPTTLLSVSGSSSDTTLVPDANIVFGGNGSNRTVTIMPAPNRFGTAIIRIMVADTGGGAVSDSFALTISPTNYLPDISDIPNQTVDEDTPISAIPFSIGDVETPTTNLILTGTSSNSALVPDANIAFGGSMDHRVIFVTPAQNQFGTTTITIAVKDGDGGVVTTRFDLTVLAINDAPTLDPPVNLTINEDAPMQTIDLTGIGSGAFNELQPLRVTAVSSDLTVIAQPTVSYVSPNATGSLSFVPVPDANGQATITVTVDDGSAVNGVVTHSFTVTVLAINDAPTLDPLTSLTINEDAQLQTVNLTGIGIGALNELQLLRVTAVSSDLTVIAQPTVSYLSPNPTGSLSFSPMPDANGQATITVTLDDGSAVNGLVTRSFTVTVLAVNDAPTLDPLASLTINEDALLQTVDLTGIGSGALNELQTLRVTAVSSDPMVVAQPTLSYTSPNPTGSLSFVPVPDANGQATITVTVDDGSGVNAVVTRGFTVTVLAVNDAPTLDPLASLTINEDAPMQTINLTGIGSGALNEFQFLRVTAVSSNLTVIAQPTVSYVSPNAIGTLSFVPVPDANGQATITVSVDDGSGVNAVVTRSFTVTVLAVNDAPTLNPLASLTINEDAPMQTVNLTGIGSGALNELQFLRVTAVSSDSTVIAQPTVSYASPNALGTLSFVPVLDANGQATITVTVDDGSGANAVLTRSFTVTVLAVNDAPTLDPLASLTINEDAPMQTINLTGIGSGALNELQFLRVTVVSSDLTVIAQPTVSYASPNATGTLSFVPVPDANGQATITVTVDDGSGANAVLTRSFTVTVLAVNDAPTLNPLASLTINEDAPMQTINLTGIGSGALNEFQTLRVTAVSSDLTVIAQPTVSYISPNAIGTLSFVPVPDANGQATITVTVDDGSGVNAVVTRSFTVTVLAVNDAPTLNPPASLTINEDAPMQTVNLTGIGGGALNELQFLRVTAVSSDLTVIAQPTVSYVSPNASGSLSFVPMPDANGQATITVTVDDGSVVNAVVTRSFTVTVLAVNDAPTLNPLASLTINEDAPMQTINLTGIGSGALNELQFLRVTVVSSDLTVIAQPTVSYISPNATGTLSFVPMPDANGQATITVTVDDGSGVNAVLTRGFTVTVLAVNDAPTISNLTDQTINENTVTAGIPIRVADIDTPVNKLKVTGSSSDTVLVPNSNIFIVGNDADRVLTIQPAANRAGSVKILITVDDNDGGLAINSFTLTVKPINQAPTLSDVGKQLTLEGQATSPITFTVGDVETDATDLKVTGSSSDTNLVPNENFSFANDGVERTLTITPAPGRNGTVTITLTVGDGIATTSKTFDLTISPVPPRITQQPVATTVLSGGDVTLFVEASGSEPLNYRWTFNGSILEGATGAKLILSAVTLQQAGDYVVVVTNSAGSTPSQAATLKILSAPVVTGQPESQVAAVGSTLTLNVAVSGEGLLLYQWRINGVNLMGATNATLLIPNVQPVNSGDYSCAITSPYGVVNSETSTVIVAIESLGMTDNFVDRKRLLAPSGIGQSSNVGATQEPREPRHAGKVGGKSMWISWVAPANGIAKWETSGSSFDTLLAVYTGDSFGNLIEITSDEDSGGFLTSAVKFNVVTGTEYEIAVDGFAGSEGIIVLGWSFVPALEPLPEIVADPQSQTVAVGANVFFSVVARGSVLSYQWLLNSVIIPGAIGSSYSITNVQMANVGSYRARVTGSTQSIDSQAGVLQLNSNAGIGDVRGIATTDKFADALTAAQASPLAPQALVRRATIRRSSNGVARGYTGTQIFSTVGSTKEEGEPNHCGEVGGASQWFAYQAEADAILTVSTDGSDFDTVLAVYTGSGADFASLREVGCDNDSGADGQDSLVRIQAIAGTVYYIAVDGVHGATGNVRLNYSLAAPLRLSAARIENGQFRLSLNGQPGGTYTIQGSVDLLTWFPLQTVQTPTGAIEITDTNSSSFHCRSYRAVKPE